MKRSSRNTDQKHQTTLGYIVEALIPFTEANIALTFKPHIFFGELEKISKRKKQTIRNAYYKAIKQGLIVMDEQNIPRLTEKGKRKTKLYKPQKLRSNGKLMVVFDIPETERHKRRHLRLLLKELSFRQVQKSVWISSYDHRAYLKAEIQQHGLAQYVLVYEASQLEI